jgi:hypothetical protein
MYKRLFLFVGSALLAVLLWSLVGRGTNSSFEDADQLVQLRRIGHELLLSAGDTKSRVLPIKKIAPNEYLIEFENAFAFTADSLVAIASRVLDPQGMKKHFIVNAIAVKSKEVIYSFGWPAEKSEIACLERPLPPTHYAINIILADEAAMMKPSRSKTIPAFAAGLLAICLGIFAWRFTRRKTPPVAEEKTPALNAAFTTIGKFRFYPGQQLLVTDDTTIELTSKETKLLRIFCDSLNEVIDRNQLLKEGWEDEGVITGRSLDMYVSKLRKKLQHDPSISIINVHGKGYRLNC